MVASDISGIGAREKGDCVGLCSTEKGNHFEFSGSFSGLSVLCGLLSFVERAF